MCRVQRHRRLHEPEVLGASDAESDEEEPPAPPPPPVRRAGAEDSASEEEEEEELDEEVSEEKFIHSAVKQVDQREQILIGAAG